MVRKRNLNNNAMNFVVSGTVLGVGSNVLGSAGINSVHGQTAVGNLAGAMPMMGSLMGAGATLQQLRRIKKK